ncbi:hypothetical protein ISCGN_014453 [Ixodes scapularis]
MQDIQVYLDRGETGPRKVVVEMMGHRVKKDSRDNPDNRDSLVFLVQRVLLESPEELLMLQRVLRARKDSLDTQDEMDYQVSKEKWVTWEEKDRRAYPVRKDFLEPPDLMVVLVFLDCLELKEKMEGQVFRAYPESRVTKVFPAAPVFPDHLVSQDRLGPLGLMVCLDSKENSESPDSLVTPITLIMYFI